jgi:hypothetical protein
VQCLVPWWREKKLDVFFSTRKAVDVRWEVVRGVLRIFSYNGWTKN